MWRGEGIHTTILWINFLSKVNPEYARVALWTFPFNTTCQQNCGGCWLKFYPNLFQPSIFDIPTNVVQLFAFTAIFLFTLEREAFQKWQFWHYFQCFLSQFIGFVFFQCKINFGDSGINKIFKTWVFIKVKIPIKTYKWDISHLEGGEFPSRSWWDDI